MSTTRPKLVVAQRIEPNTAFWCRPLTSGSFTKATLAPGLYYVAGDGQSDDLLAAIDAAVLAAIGVNTTWTVDNTTGIVTATRDTAGVVQIVETDPDAVDTDNATGLFTGVDSSNLRFTDVLGGILGVAGINFEGGGLDAARCHQGGLYPSRASVTDLPVKPHRNISQTRPTAMMPQTVKYDELDEHDLEIATKNALPWAAFYNEFDMLNDFMDNASTGRPFRHHRKREVLTLETKANPFGYRTWVLAKSSMEWRPTPAYRNFYKAFNKKLRLIEAPT